VSDLDELYPLQSLSDEADISLESVAGQDSTKEDADSAEEAAGSASSVAVVDDEGDDSTTDAVTTS